MLPLRLRPSFAAAFHCLRSYDSAFAVCVSAAFAVKTVPLHYVFPLPSWLRHCLCLVCFRCFCEKIVTLPCVFPLPLRKNSAFVLCGSTFFAAKTVPLSCRRAQVVSSILATKLSHCFWERELLLWSQVHRLDKTPPLHCASTAFIDKTLPLPCVFAYLQGWNTAFAL